MIVYYTSNGTTALTSRLCAICPENAENKGESLTSITTCCSTDLCPEGETGTSDQPTSQRHSPSVTRSSDQSTLRIRSPEGSTRTSGQATLETHAPETSATSTETKMVQVTSEGAAVQTSGLPTGTAECVSEHNAAAAALFVHMFTTWFALW
ncbi:hypothetical protein X801_03204 [Opisthorchis viverrini]|nr:hypothetical protein X801_03204 [Opisthorchis viverrini]